MLFPRSCASSSSQTPVFSSVSANSSAVVGCMVFSCCARAARRRPGLVRFAPIALWCDVARHAYQSGCHHCSDGRCYRSSSRRFAPAEDSTVLTLQLIAPAGQFDPRIYVGRAGLSRKLSWCSIHSRAHTDITGTKLRDSSRHRFCAWCWPLGVGGLSCIGHRVKPVP